MSMSEEEALRKAGEAMIEARDYIIGLGQSPKAEGWPRDQYAVLAQLELAISAWNHRSAPVTEPRGCPTPGAGETAVERAFDIGRMWNHALTGHVLDARDVCRTLGSSLFDGIPIPKWSIDMHMTRDDAITQAVADIKTGLRAALSAAPPSPGAVAVVVRTLEWSKERGSALSRAETILGTYRVWTHHDAGGGWFWNFRGAETVAKKVSCEADAKAAAQSDYEARIRSALVAHPVPAPGDVGELVTKLHRHAGNLDDFVDINAHLIASDIRSAASFLTAQAAELERAAKRHTSVWESREYWREAAVAGNDALKAAESSLASAKAEIERYREGLKPFADIQQSDSADGTQRVRQAWLTRARELVYPDKSTEPEHG